VGSFLCGAKPRVTECIAAGVCACRVVVIELSQQGGRNLEAGHSRGALVRGRLFASRAQVAAVRVQEGRDFLDGAEGGVHSLPPNAVLEHVRGAHDVRPAALQTSSLPKPACSPSVAHGRQMWYNTDVGGRERGQAPESTRRAAT
jgi:hypothetical protein